MEQGVSDRHERLVKDMIMKMQDANQDQCSILLLAAPAWLWGRCGRHNSPLHNRFCHGPRLSSFHWLSCLG